MPEHSHPLCNHASPCVHGVVNEQWIYLYYNHIHSIVNVNPMGEIRAYRPRGYQPHILAQSLHKHTMWDINDQSVQNLNKPLHMR